MTDLTTTKLLLDGGQSYIETSKGAGYKLPMDLPPARVATWLRLCEAGTPPAGVEPAEVPDAAEWILSLLTTKAKGGRSALRLEGWGVVPTVYAFVGFSTEPLWEAQASFGDIVTVKEVADRIDVDYRRVYDWLVMNPNRPDPLDPAAKRHHWRWEDVRAWLLSPAAPSSKHIVRWRQEEELRLLSDDA